MITHDYLCEKCGEMFEEFVTPEQYVVSCPVCSSHANRVYMSFGGMLGKNKGKFPYFDMQLGTTLESTAHRDRIAKERGLFVMGNDEFRRTRNAPRSVPQGPSESERAEDAKKLWDDLKYGRIPHPEPARFKDPEADTLDLKDAPQTKGD